MNNYKHWKDFDDGEVKKGYYAIRFKDHDTALAFKKSFDEARKVNMEYLL